MVRFATFLGEQGFVRGRAVYRDHYPGDSEQTPRIVLSVRVAAMPIYAIVDTGAPWCVLDPDLMHPLIACGQAEMLYNVDYIVRGHKYHGQLVRVAIDFEGEHGFYMRMESTAFVATLDENPPWYHPNFIGLSGCLDRMRFAIDPDENGFYFGKD